MTDQHTAWHLGTAFPYTMPSAVGGYDVPHKPRWRRPEDEDIPLPRAHIAEWLLPVSRSARMHDKSDLTQHGFEGPACKVKLFDITRGLPQRIEGQFRRHWGFTPALWNLYFRERVNLGIGLSVKRSACVDGPNIEVETDAAMAAADLLEKLEKGTYLNGGKRRKINGDFSKLLFAENLSKLQRKLLSDFRFRCKAIPGTQEIRTKTGHLGFWASVVYGLGIFITISPSERHNYLAVKFSRYRSDDPYAANAANFPWICQNCPKNGSDFLTRKHGLGLRDNGPPKSPLELKLAPKGFMV